MLYKIIIFTFILLICGCASATLQQTTNECVAGLKDANVEDTWASKTSELIHLYDQFNIQLKRLNLAEPMSLIDEGDDGKVYKAIRILNKTDTSVLSKFYTKAMVETDAKCYAASNCNISNLIFLAVITMSKYDVFSVNKISNESVELVIEGKTITGTEIKLVLLWLLECEQWKIDSITKIPK